jgi:hypothetical protein
VLNAGVLTFQEFAMREPLPLATIHEAVLEFLKGRDDVVVFGATAVNAYVSEPRMTQDIDLMAQNASEVAEQLRTYLNERFHIATRIRVIGDNKGYRIFQLQKSGNRHLVDVRPVGALPPFQQVEDVQVVAPAHLIAGKVISYHARIGQPKSFSDMRDLTMLLLAFPELKQMAGPVLDALVGANASQGEIAEWSKLVTQEIKPPDEDAEFD